MNFHLGDRKRGELKDFEVQLTLSADEACQVRHTALEAGRVIANTTIRKAAGIVGYSLRIRVYPHHILRENKQATGAGADRVSQGMRAAYGKNVGTAARVKRDQGLVTIQTDAAHFAVAKDALRKASMKFPTPCTITLDRGQEHLKGLI
jgi:large subunit ribosomal protein L10e